MSFVEEGRRVIELRWSSFRFLLEIFSTELFFAFGLVSADGVHCV